MRSDVIKKGYKRAPHRSLLRATGVVSEEDFEKPFIAIVNSYIDIIPGHVHLQDFGQLIKDAVRAAGNEGKTYYLRVTLTSSNKIELVDTTIGLKEISTCKLVSDEISI